MPSKPIRGLQWAGNMLILFGLLQLAGVAWFCASGGSEGMLSRVAAIAAGWPVAALLLFAGNRMRVI